MIRGTGCAQLSTWLGFISNQAKSATRGKMNIPAQGSPEKERMRGAKEGYGSWADRRSRAGRRGQDGVRGMGNTLGPAK